MHFFQHGQLFTANTTFFVHITTSSTTANISVFFRRFINISIWKYSQPFRLNRVEPLIVVVSGPLFQEWWPPRTSGGRDGSFSMSLSITWATRGISITGITCKSLVASNLKWVGVSVCPYLTNKTNELKSSGHQWLSCIYSWTRRALSGADAGALYLSSIANTWTISDDAGRTWAGPGTSSKNRLWSIPFEVQIISVGVTVEM